VNAYLRDLNSDLPVCISSDVSKITSSYTDRSPVYNLTTICPTNDLINTICNSIYPTNDRRNAVCSHCLHQLQEAAHRGPTMYSKLGWPCPRAAQSCRLGLPFQNLSQGPNGRTKMRLIHKGNHRRSLTSYINLRSDIQQNYGHIFRD